MATRYAERVGRGSCRARVACLACIVLLPGCQGGAMDAATSAPASKVAAATPRPAVAVAETAGVAAARPVREDYDLVLGQALDAMKRGDHEAAMLFFERVLGRADDPRDQIRALISLAMIRLMPSSAVADAEAAAIVMAELERRLQRFGLEREFFGELELLRTIQGRDKELRELRAGNRKLRADLAAKEELVRQLRALTVDSD